MRKDMSSNITTKFFKYLINPIFAILLGVSILASMWQLGSYIINAPHSKIIVLLICFFVIGCSVAIFFKPECFKKTCNYFQQHVQLILKIIIAVTILWQLMMAISLAGESWWDPGIISYVASHRSIQHWFPGYFSYYPNNFFLLVLERIVWNCLTIFKIASYVHLVQILAVLSYVLVDLSIWLIYKTVRQNLGQQKSAWIAAGMLWFLIGITPFAVIPYSDIPVMFLSSLVLWLGTQLNLNLARKNIILVLAIGLIVAIGYLIKPTIMIFIVALFIMVMLNLKKRTLKPVIIFALIFGLSFGTMVTAVHYYQRHNSIIKINESKSMPMNHFIAMGMAGNGGYNEQDVQKNKHIQDPQKRKEVNNQLIIERLKKRGLANYLIFLAKKQTLNTGAGTFAWGADAGYGFLVVKNSHPKNLFVKLPRKIFMQYDAPNNLWIANSNWHGVAILFQVGWTIALMTALFSIKSSNMFASLIRLTIVGAFMFLLLFEGGRSRYMVQFLPFIITLTGVGSSLIWKNNEFRSGEKNGKETN